MEGNKRVNKGYVAWLLILGAFLLIGIAAWVYELIFGLGVTGMRDVISWGLYIISFTFFVKLSAGGLIVASSAEVFGAKALRPLAKLGVLTAAVCISVAGLSIIADLGRPDRILNLFMHAHVTSPMVWDVTIVSLYFLLAVVELWLMSGKNHSVGRERTLKTLAVIGLPAAFSLHSITAFIFGLQISRPFWNTALMPPLFVVSAIVSGTALVAIIVWILEKIKAVKLSGKTWNTLCILMAVSLAIDLFMTFCDYLTTLWDKVPDDLKVLSTLLPGGRYEPLFWLEWVIGGAIPFIILVVPSLKRRVGLVAIAALLILVGVFAFQTELVVAGMANPLIQLPPGISVGTFTLGASSFELVGQYMPTWVELAILIGLLALIAILTILGYRFLNIKGSMKDSEESWSQSVRGETT
ncbi:NrfD/PsrC family molybdoenzyme membrane anchor subunit [Brevibacillus ginsengisoli]|uniref:NrfD/PsrC family molybdoenzyme membrane anchor subunit n=1 Tax=Brevibacillus ginsengisoli TaxID=363854 RepID=UPI003CEF2683